MRVREYWNWRDAECVHKTPRGITVSRAIRSTFTGFKWKVEESHVEYTINVMTMNMNSDM